MQRGIGRMSGLAPGTKSNKSLGFGSSSLGQSYPQPCPYPEAPSRQPQGRSLGIPLSLREAASLIGCSPWTVRQTLVPKGLPCFRSGPGGKLLFYTNQIVRWIEDQQRGG